MQKIDFNKDWICRCLTRDEEAYPVTLPHDAMLSEPRTQESTGKGNVGWYIGGDYEYTKNFFVPEEYKDKKVLIEFEGIYHNGEVYINGKKAAYRPHGYTNFYVDTEGFFQYGKENEIKVIARNADQPNSRWYSGAGIYRDVYLLESGLTHIVPEGVQVKTENADDAYATLRVATELENKTAVPQDLVIETVIKDDEENVAKLAIQHFGSIEKYTEEMKYNLEHFSEIMDKEWNEDAEKIAAQSDLLYGKLTANLACDVSSPKIQEIVYEILEFIKKQSSSVTLDKPLIDILIDSYSNDYVKNITDKKYGDGASDYIVKAFRYYSENNTPSKK